MTNRRRMSKHSLGPINPVAQQPNAINAYTKNPLEDLPVKEQMESNVAGDYCSEPVFSAQAIYGITHHPESYDSKKKRD